MNILVVGSGGREHAICAAFDRSPRVKNIYCAKGNPGISRLAECVPIMAEEVQKLSDFAVSHSIDLTFVGGETSLALGIVDEFEKRGLRIIGPTKSAAALESSKAFSKDFMDRHAIPTANYRNADSADEAIAIIGASVFGDEHSSVVVKASGLAAGKGVVVAANRSEAVEAVRGLANIAGDAAAERIVLEECLIGKEVSLIMFVDGEDFALMPPTRDHKRIGEGDTGPNTGGMGTFTDPSLLTNEQTLEIIETIIKPTLRGCKDEGFPFRGILFLGLMITAEGPKLLEYNVRFGDPETQSILVRLETDLVDICEAMSEGRLSEIDIKWTPGCSATVVLASKGYPQSPRMGDVITGLEDIEGVTVFHAGTATNDAGGIVTAGGRVLGITATGDDLDVALSACYREVAKISFEGMQYRRDIGVS